MAKKITVEVDVQGSPEKVWRVWTEPEHIRAWAFASDDWECPYAENDVKVGGRFVTRMSSKDKANSFDIPGVYTAVEEYTHMAYTMEGGRTVDVTFTPIEGGVRVTEIFEMEDENPEEMQRAGWQAILNNFKKHAERVGE